MMYKPSVVVINEDQTFGKIMPGLNFIKAFFPELLKVEGEKPTTDPVDQPGPVGPPIVEQPKPEPEPELIPKPSVLDYEWEELGRGRAAGFPVYLVHFPDKPRIVEDYTTLGRWRMEKFGVCGFDFEINLLPGVKQPTGPSTGNYGMNTPPDFVCPDDFVEGNWPAGSDGKLGRKFFVWKQSKLNTEPVKPDVVTPTPKPGPVVTIEDGAKNFSVIETGNATVNGDPTTYIWTA